MCESREGYRQVIDGQPDGEGGTYPGLSSVRSAHHDPAAIARSILQPDALELVVPSHAKGIMTVGLYRFL